VSFKYTDSIQRPGERAQGLGKMMTNIVVRAISGHPDVSNVFNSII